MENQTSKDKAMLKVPPLKTTSVKFGSGAADPQPARIPMPTTGMPDRVVPDNQRNMALKVGVKGPDMKHNPGRKR
jgi:hypothetical protein